MVGGKYLEVVPYSRVVFTWGWEGSPLPLGSTTVEITLVPEAGGTRLYLRHRGIPAEQRDFQAAGWDHVMDVPFPPSIIDLCRQYTRNHQHCHAGVRAETTSAAITGSDDARGVLSAVRHPSSWEGLP